MIKTVLVCQNRTCTKQGAAEVLAEFQARQNAQFTVEASGCLGQCGNGVMVCVLPEEVWYWRVCSLEVEFIVDRHLLAGKPVTAMLFPG